MRVPPRGVRIHCRFLAHGVAGPLFQRPNRPATVVEVRVLCMRYDDASAVLEEGVPSTKKMAALGRGSTPPSRLSFPRALVFPPGTSAFVLPGLNFTLGVGRVLVAVNPKNAARIFEFVHGEMACCPMLEIPGQPGRPVLYYINLCCMSQAVHPVGVLTLADRSRAHSPSPLIDNPVLSMMR